MTWFYCAVVLAGAWFDWGLLSSFAVMWLTCTMYAFMKRTLYGLVGLRVTTVCYGVLPVHSTQYVASGCTYVHGILPIFPFIDYEDRSAGPRVAFTSGVRRWWTGIRAMLCNITVAFLFVWTLTTVSFWGWGYPAGRSAISVRSIGSASEAVRRGVRAGDELVMVGETVITDASQIKTLASRGGVALFASERGFSTMRFDRDTQTNLEFEGRPLAKRIRIREVADNSIAWNAGLRRGNVILRIDDADIKGIDDLLVRIRRNIGGSVKLGILHDETMLADVQLRVLSGNREAIGMVIDAAYDLRRRPVKIMDVKLDGPAAQSGLTSGDIIIAVQGEAIAGLGDLHDRVARRLKSGARLAVVRGDRIMDVAVRPALTEGSVDMLGASYREASLGRINAKLAACAGFDYARYALAVPFQLLGQILSGLVDPFGIYGTWSSYLAAGVPRVELGRRSAWTWFERARQSLNWFTAYALSTVVPFMLLIEYFACAKVLVTACGPGLKAVFGTVIVCLTVAWLLVWMTNSDWLVNAYEFPAFDQSVLTVRSLWWL